MSRPNPLEVWRINQCLTKTEAAAKLGVATQYYHEWIKGRHLPNSSKAETIRAVTGITRSDLLKWADEKGSAS